MNSSAILPKGKTARPEKSLTQRLFEQRLKLIFHLQKREEDEYQQYAQELRSHLHNQVNQLEETSFLVRQHWHMVEKYRDLYCFNALNGLDVKELADHIAPLVFESEKDELAKRFDQLCYTMELDVLLKGSIASHLVQETISLAYALSKRGAIPMVNAKMDLIKKVQSSSFWSGMQQQQLEHLRKEFRNLMRFIKTEKRPPVYTDLDDELLQVVDPQPVVITSANLDVYKKRVTHYLMQNRTHLTIHKLRTNQNITLADLQELERMLFEQGALGTREQFEKAYGKQPMGKFVRSIVGLDITSAREVFSTFINNPSMNAQQIRFMDTIIQYLTTNGVIEVDNLFESPFTEVSTQGFLGLFTPDQANELVSLIDQVNKYAEVG